MPSDSKPNEPVNEPATQEAASCCARATLRYGSTEEGPHVKRLSVEQRDQLRTMFLARLSVAYIAQTMGVPKRTVWRHTQDLRRYQAEAEATVQP